MKKVKNFRLKKILYNNTLLKVVSILIAVILWAYIIIIIDAPTERTFRDVTINTINEQVLSDNGYSIEKLSVQTATVKIEGSRKIIAKFDSDNISANLDFSDINSAKLADEDVITVNLKVVSEFGDIVSFTPSAVDVHIEATKYKDVDVKYNISGSLLEGYIQGDAELSQEKVRIFGAQANLDQVSYAQVNLDLINTKFDSYSSGELTQDCSVVLYNNDNKPLSEKESRWIWNNSPDITVTCPIYKVVTAVVEPNVSSAALAASLKCEPSFVEVYGDNEKIEDYVHIETMPITQTVFDNDSYVDVKLNIPSWMKVVDNISEVRVSANSD